MEERLESLEKLIDEVSLNSQNFQQSLLQSLKSNLENWLNESSVISNLYNLIDISDRKSREIVLDWKKDQKKIEKELDESKILTTNNHSDINKLRNHLDCVISDIKLRAYSGDLAKLEKLLENKCSWDFANKISSKLKNYAETTEVKKLNDEFAKFSKSVFEEYFSKEEGKVYFGKMQRKIEIIVNEYATKDYVREHFKKCAEKFEEIDKNYEKVMDVQRYGYDEVKKEIGKIKSDAMDNVKQLQLEKLKKECDLKLNQLEFDGFTEKIFPKIEGFSLEFLKIKEIIDDQEKAMLRLDEILLEKAAKIDIMKIRDEMSEFPAAIHLEKIKTLTEKTENHSKLIETLSKTIKDLSKISSDSSSIKLSTETELKLIKGRMLELENKLSYKAETSEMFEQLEKKASWDDFSHVIESIEAVHNQTKLLATQLVPVTTNSNSNRAKSHSKITKKIVDMVLTSKPTYDDTPSLSRTFIKVPTPNDFIRTRVNTPKRSYFSPFVANSNA